MGSPRQALPLQGCFHQSPWKMGKIRNYSAQRLPDQWLLQSCHPSQSPLFFLIFIFSWWDISLNNFKLSLCCVPLLYGFRDPSGSALGDRIIVLKPVLVKQILILPSVRPPPRHHQRNEPWSILCKIFYPFPGMHAWLWVVVVQVSLFLEAKIFPEWRRETRMIDSPEPSLISCLAGSLVMCIHCWCAGEWQLIDSTALGDREDEACLERLTRAVYAVLWTQALPP